MRLVTFEHDGMARIGALRDEDTRVADLGVDPSLPATMVELVAAGEPAMARVRDVLASAPTLPVSEVLLRAPIRPRNNVMCVGKNYREHAAEFAASGYDAAQRRAVPEHPVVFTKALSALAGPLDPIHATSDPTGTTDYEGELAVVIGRGGTRIPARQAWDHVFGFTAFNDVTVRELQRRHVQFFIGKSAAGSGPMGPCLVTRDEVPDVAALRVRTTVNGELRQSAPLADLIFPVPVLIEAISAAVLLEPGDVIATGTPAGVALGYDPPRYLAAGDVVEVSIDRIGVLRNPVV